MKTISEKEKAIKIIKKIRERESQMWNQYCFCKDHNFNLEAEKFKSIEEELRRICMMLEREFETGYVSVS